MEKPALAQVVKDPARRRLPSEGRLLCALRRAECPALRGLRSPRHRYSIACGSHVASAGTKSTISAATRISRK